MRNDTQEHQQVSRAAGRGVGLRLRALSKSFSGRTVLHDIDLDIEPGEFVAIVGRSGCGKSTLLRLVAQLDGASGGEVVYEHEGSGEPEIRIMFQDARLLPWKRVQANVALGLPKQAAPQALHALRQVGLDQRAGEWPAVLSGGQRQRVALARALVHDPQLLLLDEPLGALDALTRIEMQALIESLWRERGFTALLVTHDVQEAIALADRVLLIEDGHVALDQRIELARPRSRGQAQFAALEEAILARVLRHPGSEAATEPSEDFFAPRGVHQVQWAV
ncbi:ATP-binding cassette domain-containing protein [Herbaspirillum sp.]|uniref:ATP-binding cassette domain-containing protein n=1 Tax=Herbaspirillum TaxID=963 RepID=UPI00259057C4|nr:ATP-binding cassette domain-containing protein [Herbaspirillum sp.]MCP3656909.1 ATP-binding cassette domain-containing protein [Herbaspirillum sp.]MCP3946264.1 ATP-binding cassette domain-containing protein [Herbaspirillum sp.]MCP4033429.1 ATP-binding cassette domain-containing protein [Herbaspirillum sp.]MCP4557438.1 ATP-binding cassette domain-containing protein [Herbaspirillum sp.]